jgi:ferredoxin-NADP reductase
MRALLEQATPAHAPLVLARAHSAADLPLAQEFDQLARDRAGAVIPVTGPRTAFPGGNPFTAEALAAHIPDLRERAVFVCGPKALQDRVCRELERAGVPRDQIHSERFAW